MRDNRNRYNDKWNEYGHPDHYRYRHRRNLRHFERDQQRLNKD